MENLFNSLVTLTKERPSNFYANYQEIDGHKVVVFDYSKTTFTNDFGYKNALETRGSVFEVNEDNSFKNVLALPFEKFFNVFEYDNAQPNFYATINNHYNVSIGNSNDLLSLPIVNILSKEDGSIISSYMLDGKLRLKSNSSLTSEYAKKAEEMMFKQFPELWEKTYEITSQGYTVNFEMIWLLGNQAPPVLKYNPSQEGFYALSARNIKTGEYVSYDNLKKHFGEYVVNQPDIDLTRALSDMRNAVGIEGYVVTTESGLRYKMKTDWYFEEHRKIWQSVTPRIVFSAFLEGVADDMSSVLHESRRPLFSYYLNKTIEMYEEIVSSSISLHDKYKNEPNNTFYNLIKAEPFDTPTASAIKMLASRIRSRGNVKDAQVDLIKSLNSRKALAQLGISSFRDDYIRDTGLEADEDE